MKRNLIAVCVGFALAFFTLTTPQQFGLKVYNPNILQLLHLEQPVQALYLPSIVKSITAINITGTSTQTVSVTQANSILIVAGFPAGGGTWDNIAGRMVITNGTTITSTSCPGIGCTGSLVEFYGGFTKSQGCNTVTKANGASSGTQTLSPAVVVAKTLLSNTGQTTTDNVNGASSLSLLDTVTSTVQVTATANNNLGGAVTGSYCYLEFK